MKWVAYDDSGSTADSLSSNTTSDIDLALGFRSRVFGSVDILRFTFLLFDRGLKNRSEPPVGRGVGEDCGDLGAYGFGTASEATG